MKEQIFNYVLRNGGVTFAEIPLICGDAANGALAMYIPEYPNIILWDGLSDEVIDAINALLKEEKIHLHPTIAMVYLCDGAAVRLPIAKTIRHYKSPRWLPVVFNAGPAKKAKE